MDGRLKMLWVDGIVPAVVDASDAFAFAVDVDDDGKLLQSGQLECLYTIFDNIAKPLVRLQDDEHGQCSGPSPTLSSAAVVQRPQ